jgi:pyruvate-ferredoxin/flavodoxin oxidoreductase
LELNREGRGSAWSNSLFEDNAEFGLGFRLTIDKRTDYAHELLERLRSFLGEDLVQGLLTGGQSTPTGIYEQGKRVTELKNKLRSADGRDAP